MYILLILLQCVYFVDIITMCIFCWYDHNVYILLILSHCVYVVDIVTMCIFCWY